MAAKWSFLVGLVVHAVVARHVAVAVGPEQGHQVDPLDHGVVLAGPVAGDELDGLGVRLVEGRVVDDEDAVVEADVVPGLAPERLGVGLEAVQQSGEGVVGRGSGRSGWTLAASVAVYTLGVAMRNCMESSRWTLGSLVGQS